MSNSIISFQCFVLGRSKNILFTLNSKSALLKDSLSTMNFSAIISSTGVNLEKIFLNIGCNEYDLKTLNLSIMIYYRIASIRSRLNYGIS